jgi:formylglycine-generating enzyme required for sulfatase activity
MNASSPLAARASSTRLLLCACAALLAALASIPSPATADDKHDDRIEGPIVSVPRQTVTLGTAKEDVPKITTLCEAYFDRLECKKPSLFDPEIPARKVVVEAFQIHKYEVTNAQYLACIKAGTCAPVDIKSCRIYDDVADNWKGKELDSSQSLPTHPAVCVSWEQAQTFCAWTGGSLPTEQQWEAAARGSDGRWFPWGNTFDPKRANWGDFAQIEGPRELYDDFGAIDDYDTTSPVGEFDNASPFGAYDMAGNVWEWTSDDFPGAKPDKEGRLQKVYRGGGYLSNPAYMRAAFRDYAGPAYSASHLGFRCAY